MKNAIEMNEMELTCVNGGSIWDDITDFANDVYDGAKKFVEDIVDTTVEIAEKVIDDIRNPVPEPVPFEKYFPPFPVQ